MSVGSGANPAPAERAAPSDILLVICERQIRRVLRTVLRGFGHRVAQAESAAGALRQLDAGQPDLLLIDTGLPDMDGTLVIQQLREHSALPVLALVGRNDAAAARRALESGADDILYKPFVAGGLLSRLAAVRGARTNSGGALRFDGFVIDLAKRTLTRDGRPLPVAAEDLAVLAALAARHRLVISDEQLVRAAWGDGSRLDLRLAVHRLRALIESDPLRPHLLLTEAGIGYRLGAEKVRI